MRAGTTVSSYAHIVDPNRNWYSNTRLIILNFWILLLFLTSVANAYDASTIFTLESFPQWTKYFNNPTGGRLNLLNSMQTIGSVAALPFSPYVADGLGRRTSIFIGALIMCVAAAVQTAATSLGMFLGARFLIGFGLTLTTTAAPILVAEIAYPTYCGPLTSAYNSVWYLGVIVATWSTFGAAKIQTTWSWRLPSIIQSVPSVLQVALIWFGPESPRWLMSKNRNAEALKTLAYYHADGNQDDPLVRFEYNKIKAAIGREIAAKVGWKTLFSTAGYRTRVNILFFLAYTSTWYAFPLQKALVTVNITDPDTQLRLGSVFQIWNLFWALIGASLVDKVGRRVLFLTSFAGMTVLFSLQLACSSVYAKSGDQATAHAIVGLIFLFFGFFAIASPVLLVSYAVEIFPYSLRAKGLTVFYFGVHSAYAFNAHVHLPFAFGPLVWKFSTIYIVVLVVQGCFLWYFVIDTRNRTLEEAGILFDGADAVDVADSATQDSSHSTEDDEKARQTFHEFSH